MVQVASLNPRRKTRGMIETVNEQLKNQFNYFSPPTK